MTGFYRVRRRILTAFCVVAAYGMLALILHHVELGLPAAGYAGLAALMAVLALAGQTRHRFGRRPALQAGQRLRTARICA